MKVGDLIPAYLGTDAQGCVHNASDYAGRKLVIYFYPKDGTSGCTAQACSLRDGYSELLRRGCALLGVSKDSAQSHQRFALKYDLPFPLLVDDDHRLQEVFGVWRLKKMAGREYMGTVRTTFVIDEQGRVAAVIDKVNTKDHAREVLDVLNGME